MKSATSDDGARPPLTPGAVARRLVTSARGRLPAQRRDRIVLAALVAVLAAGALLRLAFVVAWQPAFMGWPDAASYIDVSQGELFGNELRPAGYPLFLRALYTAVPSLVLVVVVQHLMGLASAALLYGAVVRAGAPRAVGLLPAAVVALGGDGLFLEHSPISEPLFIFLVCCAAYAGVRSLDAPGVGWPALCGLALALSATVRVVALPLLPCYAVWLVARSQGRPARRLAVVAAGAGSALAILGTYYVVEESAVGRTGLSRNGLWNVYGRVAPFADCSRFDPPPGTEAFCETTPRSERPLTYQYTFNWYYSPAIRMLDNPHSASSGETSQVAAFAWAAILGQPLDYAEEVGAGLLRFVAPDSFRGYGGGPSYDDLVHDEVLFKPTFQKEGRRVAALHYSDATRYEVDRGLLAALRDWESVTRVQGPVFALLALLAAAAPFASRGRARDASVLLVVTAGVLLVVPVATVEFSARSAVPGFGPLAAAAALGLAGILSRRARPR